MEEQLFRQQVAVLNALPAHIALLDTSGTIVWVNEAWLRFERAEAQGACLGVGLNYLQVCDVATGDYSEEAGSVGSGIRSVIRGEIPAFGLEYPCHSPTERRWFRLMVTPLDAVRPGGVVVMHTNVTERRLAEERLREALARSAEAERIAQLGSWELSLLDLEHLSNNPITVSDELLRIAGVEPGTERPTAADLVRLLPTEAQDELRAALRTALRERRPYSLVHRILWADGTERVVHQRGRCFFDEATDQPLKLVGTARDITEQTRTDEAVRQSEREQRLLAQQLEGERARLAAAQRVAKVGSWETDLATLEVTWSDEIHRIFETEPATFRPTHPRFLERIHPEDRAAVEQAFLDSSNVHEPCSIEHRILLPGGGTKTVEERWQTIFEEGRAVRAIGTCHDITDRKRADEALRSSRDLLRIASNAARLGGWMLELPSQNFSFSEELIAIHELPENADPSQEELIALYDPGPREVLRRHLDACLRDGTPYDVELPKRTASGRQIWLRSIGEAVRDADGRIVRLQGAGQDITSRKLAEQELARMNRALRLLSSCTDAVVRAQSEQALLDQVCRIAVEEGGYRLACVGYAEQDPAKTLRIHASAGVGTGYLDGLSLSWSSEVAAGNGPAGRAIRTGELVASRDVAADAGFAVWRDRALAHGIRSVLCFPLREAASTFGVLCLYAAEVSEAGADELELLEELAEELAFGIVHLRAREEHRRSEQTVREQAALLEQTSEAIFVRDLEDRITYWNRGAERLYGWSSDEVVGRRAAELFHRNDATRLAQARSAQEHGLATGAWVGELHKLDKAGGTRLIAARWSLLRDATGQPRAILTIDADITEKRRIETQLLRNQRLESIGTLAGGIAHDLNNVLTPILVSLSMLSEEETDPSKREDLAVLETAARRGAAMVGQLLSFARGEPQGPHKRVEVGAIAGEVLKMVRETFPKDISAVFQKGESPWAIQGDATQIHQLLTNLCVNARDAMPNGGVLTVALEGVVVDDLYAGMSAETPSGRYLRLRVEDTGSGMAPEVRDRIFEPFFTTKPSGSGTGLGLSTCHAIARNHGGFILVTSERGKGSRFDVYLPADVSSQAPAEAASARADLLLGRGELVLVVDDEEAIRKVTRRTLERYGYRVLLAAHGADAVALYAANAGAIAAVLTDMSMPIMDGPTTIVALQAIDPSVRIIGSTGLDSDGKAAKARALGVTHWVPKPYTAELLLQMLRAVIG
jgi:PAS domain S-box-containing protein